MLLRTTLAYYDHTQPLVLWIDASEYGLSTALLINNKPIAFASKMLLMLRPDKPLQMLQRKPIHAAPPRLQYMLLRLQNYKYMIQYVAGKDMVLADRLSRIPLRENNSPIELHQDIQTLHFNHDCLNLIRGAIERDPVHTTVYRLTLNGWSDKMTGASNIACHFWGTRDKLTIEEGVLLEGNKVCIPSEIHDRTLYGLHDSHCSVEKMTHLTRTHVYWPRVNKDIADSVSHCTICARHKASQTVQPMLP